MSHFSKVYNRSLGGKKNLSASNFCYFILINQSHPLNQADFPLSSPKQNQVLSDADELNPQHNAKHNASEGHCSGFILKGPMFTALLFALTLWVWRKLLRKCELIIKATSISGHTCQEESPQYSICFPHFLVKVLPCRIWLLWKEGFSQASRANWIILPKERQAKCHLCLDAEENLSHFFILNHEISCIITSLKYLVSPWVDSWPPLLALTRNTPVSILPKEKLDLLFIGDTWCFGHAISCISQDFIEEQNHWNIYLH